MASEQQASYQLPATRNHPSDQWLERRTTRSRALGTLKRSRHREETRQWRSTNQSRSVSPIAALCAGASCSRCCSRIIRLNGSIASSIREEHHPLVLKGAKLMRDWLEGPHCTYAEPSICSSLAKSILSIVQSDRGHGDSSQFAPQHRGTRQIILPEFGERETPSNQGAPTHFAGVGSAPGPPQHHQYIRDDACGNETSSVAELRLVDCFDLQSELFSCALPETCIGRSVGLYNSLLGLRRTSSFLFMTRQTSNETHAGHLEERCRAW